jgi:hypothetical protein
VSPSQYLVAGISAVLHSLVPSCWQERLNALASQLALQGTTSDQVLTVGISAELCCCAIVACRKDCEVLASQLLAVGLAAAHYHADMEPAARQAAHSSWSTGDVQVRCLTKADMTTACLLCSVVGCVLCLAHEHGWCGMEWVADNIARQ